MTEKYDEPIPVLCWIDLETTGLNSMQDIPLEVGIILTDIRLNEFARESWLCTVRDFIWEPTDPFVLEMHTKNGLLEEMNNVVGQYISYTTIDEEIEDWLIKQLTLQYGLTERQNLVIHPAGSSVHFDLDFIRKRFPSFYRQLHHRHYDVSSIKMFYQTLLGAYDPGPIDDHRALADLDNDIAWIRQRDEEFSAILSKQILG